MFHADLAKDTRQVAHRHAKHRITQSDKTPLQFADSPEVVLARFVLGRIGTIILATKLRSAHSLHNSTLARGRGRK